MSEDTRTLPGLDEAVEAAAKDAYERAWADGGTGGAWADRGEHVKRPYRRIIGRHVEAAYPAIAAALREHIAQEIEAMWRPIGVHLADPADAWDAARESAATVARGGVR